MSSSSDFTPYIPLIIVGAGFIVSEVMPFVNKKYQGIFHCLVQVLLKCPGLTPSESIALHEVNKA